MFSSPSHPKPVEGSSFSPCSATPLLLHEPALAGAVLGTGKADARCTSAGNRTSGSHTCSPLEPELQPKPSARRALPLPTHLCSSSWESKAASPVWHICPHIPLSRCAQLFLTLKRDAPVPPTENRYPSLSETVFVKAKVSVNYNFMDVLLLVWVH